MQIKIRDKRSRGWFFLDNEYLNGYAKIFGAVGTAIYVSLCRHADAEQKCFPAQELIAKELGIAQRTIRKYIKLFEDHNLICVIRDKANYQKGLSNIYYLIDKSEWLKRPTEANNASVLQRQITTGTEANNDISQRQPLPPKDTNRKNTHKKNTKEVENGRFALPSLKEVKDYCLERNNGIDAQNFIDFYSSKGWMIGKNKMKDWRAAVRTWENRNKPAKSEVNIKYQGL